MTTTAQVESVSTAASRQEAAPTPAAAPGRDAHGRFTKGNAGGPGNPFARRTAALRQAFLDTVTDEDVRAVTQKLIALARAGDTAAMKLFFQYSIGKPAPAVDPDHLDVEEWQHYKEQAGMMRELPGLIGMPAPDLPLDCMRAARPAVTDQMARQTAAALSDPEAFYAAEEKARQQQLRRLERQAPSDAAKYADVVPDESGLPPDVKPIAPKENGKQRRRDRKRPGDASSIASPESAPTLSTEELMDQIWPESVASGGRHEPDTLIGPSGNGENGDCRRAPSRNSPRRARRRAPTVADGSNGQSPR